MDLPGGDDLICSRADLGQGRKKPGYLYFCSVNCLFPVIDRSRVVYH